MSGMDIRSRLGERDIPLPATGPDATFTTIEQQGERHGVVSRIARQLDIGPETLRHWIPSCER
jgi:hypothetical protein